MSSPAVPALNYVPAPKRVRVAYCIECMGSLAANFIQVGIFFYTHHEYGWGLMQNFLLAAAQGLVYVVGALAAGPIARRMGRRGGLIVLQSLLVLLTAVAVICIRVPWVVTCVILGYVVVIAASWPMLESLISHGDDVHGDDGGHTLSRRIAIYNLVWAASGTLTVGISGTIIEKVPKGVFMIPLFAHLISAILLAVFRDLEAPPSDAHESKPQAESELERLRELALWLSRICLPATYVIVYGLMAMMPSLPLLKGLSASATTLVGCAWMAARFIAFVVLGATTFWHTRPRILLLAATSILVSFLAVTLRLGLYSPIPVSPVIQLTWMIAWEMVLGMAMGMIYAASLYFGMVLSRGSTEQGGYHEALIGLGAMLGPGVGAITQWARPGSVGWGVAAVTSVLAISVIGASYVALTKHGRDVNGT